MIRIYALLCVLGAALPIILFAPFLSPHGMDAREFVRQMFVNPVSSFFAADVIVSSLVLWTFMAREMKDRPVRLWWVCVLANLTVGVSLAFPLFLLLREIAIRRSGGSGLAPKPV